MMTTMTIPTPNRRSWQRVIGLLVTLALLLAACGGTASDDSPPAGQAGACEVPEILGLDQASAERMVEGLGLLPVRRAEFSATIPEGHVMAQEPAGGTRLAPCAGEVRVVVSLGATSGASPAPDHVPAATAGDRPLITPDNADQLFSIATLAAADDMGGGLSVAFSPDGHMLASGSGDGTIWLWDVATGRSIATLEGHTDGVFSVAFSPDGRILASGSFDSTIRLWDVGTGRSTATLEGHTGYVTSVAFSPDGRMLASGSGDNTIRLWDVATGRSTATLEGHTHGVFSVAFSPDGRMLASGSEDSTIRLWDVGTGRSTAILEGHTGDVFMAFSPDGRMLASGSSDKTIRLWDVATGRSTATLQGHAGYVTSVAFSPDGRMLASGSLDNTIWLWDVATGRSIATLEGHTDGVFSVAFSPDGRMLASGSSDSTIQLWAVRTEAELMAINRLREPIQGKWVIIRDTNGEIEREAGMPDYDYVFLPDGTMISFDTMGGSRVFEYVIVDDKQLQLRLYGGDVEMQVTIAGDRMTLIGNGSYEIELERAGSIDLAAIERIRERTREAIAGTWLLRLDSVYEWTNSFYQDGTVRMFDVRSNEYEYADYDFVDDRHMYIKGRDGGMFVQFSLSGDRMTWVMNGTEVELERIGPAD